MNKYNASNFMEQLNAYVDDRIALARLEDAYKGDANGVPFDSALEITKRLHFATTQMQEALESE